MTHCDESNSEFGAGIVVCLAKFSEHLSNHWGQRVAHVIAWEKTTAQRRAQLELEAQRFPRGDAANVVAAVATAETCGGLSHCIELWMNGASDHFYDLHEDAPPSLKELASLTLKIGHTFTEQVWGAAHVRQIWKLWKQACLEVDEALHVQPDWGRW